MIPYQHVKWFTEETPARAAIEQVISPWFIAVALITAFILGVLPQLAPKLMHWKRAQTIDHYLADLQKHIPLLLRIGLSISLILQLLFDSILAPEIPLTQGTLLLAIATAILVLIPHVRFIQAGAIGLLLLFAEAVLRMGLFHMIDYVFYLAISFALFVIHTRHHELGTPALYLGTGFSLCWVAAEKWVYPVLSADILHHHDIPTFGIEPEIFILLTAFIEFVVGYLLIVGLLNRLLAMVLTGIFISTTLVFGVLEVVGHLMIHIILIIFIIKGTGFYKPPVNMHDRTLDKIIFVVLNFLFILASVLLLYYRFA